VEIDVQLHVYNNLHLKYVMYNYNKNQEIVDEHEYIYMINHQYKSKEVASEDNYESFEQIMD
jgi:hypothetical protein